MYHRVGKTHNDWESRYGIEATDFTSHMHAMCDAGYRAVSIDQLVNWLESGTALPKGAFLITFDDGFRGVLEHAMPVLADLGWPATIFLVSDLIGARDVWTRESNPAGVTYPLLDAGEIDRMQTQGFSFHSHTCSHPSLPTLSDDELADQLGKSRTTLQKLLGHNVDYLAYPFGHLDQRVEAATRAAGYRAAFSTQPGFNRRDVNRFRIRRLDVFGTDSARMLLRKASLGTNDGRLSNAARYYARQLTRRIPGIG